MKGLPITKYINKNATHAQFVQNSSPDVLKVPLFWAARCFRRGEELLVLIYIWMEEVGCLKMQPIAVIFFLGHIINCSVTYSKITFKWLLERG